MDTMDGMYCSEHDFHYKGPTCPGCERDALRAKLADRQARLDVLRVEHTKHITALREKLERVEELLTRARLAMMEPHGEWKDVRENKLIVEIRAALEGE